jgi:hypothetical protein
VCVNKLICFTTSSLYIHDHVFDARLPIISRFHGAGKLLVLLTFETSVRRFVLHAPADVFLLAVQAGALLFLSPRLVVRDALVVVLRGEALLPQVLLLPVVRVIRIVVDRAQACLLAGAESTLLDAGPALFNHRQRVPSFNVPILVIKVLHLV